MPRLSPLSRLPLCRFLAWLVACVPSSLLRPSFFFLLILTMTRHIRAAVPGLAARPRQPREPLQGLAALRPTSLSSALSWLRHQTRHGPCGTDRKRFNGRVAGSCVVRVGAAPSPLPSLSLFLSPHNRSPRLSRQFVSSCSAPEGRSEHRSARALASHAIAISESGQPSLLRLLLWSQ